MRILKKKANYLVANNLNEILNQLSVIEERLLYLMIKGIKKEYFKIKKEFDDDTEEVPLFDRDEIFENLEDRVYDFTIECCDISKALNKTKLSKKDIIKTLERFPLAIRREKDNGDQVLVLLFKKIKYIADKDVFYVELTEYFYEYIYFEMFCKKFTRIYHDEFFRLNSKSSQKLYRLCTRYFEQRNLNQKIETLVKYFGFENINVKDISKSLKRAVDKINKETQFEVSYKKVKKGRCISNVIWSFRN